MAKALLKTNILDCPRLTDEDRNDDCKLENILREIVNGQWQRAHIKARRALCDLATLIGGLEKGELG